MCLVGDNQEVLLCEFVQVNSVPELTEATEYLEELETLVAR